MLSQAQELAAGGVHKSMKLYRNLRISSGMVMYLKKVNKLLNPQGCKHQGWPMGSEAFNVHWLLCEFQNLF